MSRDKPSLGNAFRIFWSSKQPFAKRCVTAVQNNLIKVRTRKDCCGNYGEPGC